MPKIRPGMKKPPADFHQLNNTLDEFESEMRDAVASANDAKLTASSSAQKVNRINFKRTRFVYDKCFKAKEISQQCFEYCCEMGFIDASLAKRWRIQGYETLCCLDCVSANKGKEGKSSCACRVPSLRMESGGCSHCGCQGCGGGGGKHIAVKKPEPVKAEEVAQPAEVAIELHTQAPVTVEAQARSD